MPNLSQANAEVKYSMFKGEPGTRKSTCALSYPKPQYWFSWDRKMSDMLLPMLKWKIKPEEIDYDDYEDWTNARKKLELLQTNCKYKTLVFDSVTSCADMALRQTLKAKDHRKVAGIAVNEIEDFNAEASVLNELIAMTKDIHSYHKVNIILIAHVIQAEYKSMDGKTHFSRTIVTAGKRVAPKIPAYCGEVYHFDIDSGLREGSKGDYVAWTIPTGDDFARTGLPLDSKIKFNDDPLYDKWIAPAIQNLKRGLV